MNSLLNSKTGQEKFTLAGFASIAIALLIAAVILGMGATILDKIQTTQSDDSATIGTNESFSWVENNSVFSVVQSRINNVIMYCNVTLMGSGVNYTVVGDTIRVQNQTAAPSVDSFQNCFYNVTYSYSFGSAARNSTGFGLTGIVVMSEFIPTIAIVAVAAIVIGIILVMFGRRKDGSVG